MASRTGTHGGATDHAPGPRPPDPARRPRRRVPAMLKVALVDDSPEVRGALRSLLGLIEGVQVVGAAGDGAEALRLIGDTDPDVVMLDVVLHGRDDGFEVLRQVKARQPRTAVIVLSHIGWPAMRDRFLGAGAQAYFDKGLQFMQALEWIRERAARAA